MQFKTLLIAICFWCQAVVVGCGKDKPAPINPGPVAPPDTSLKAMMPFAIGAAVNVSLLKNNNAYRQIVVKEFSSITAENAMKFAGLHPAENTYNWVDADYLADFAQQQGKRLHGHTLIWHNSLPAWVTNFSGDSAAWENLMKTHIQTVVTHFKGKAVSWDVVNEAVNEDGSMRNSVWLQHLGAGYIARAFVYAHQADSSALLFYNDYGHEYGPTKRTAILNLVNGLINSGVPIHGIGLQMHTRYNQEESNWQNAINTAAQTGLKVHLSELDVAMNPENDQTKIFTAALAATQAAVYKAMVMAYHALPAAQKFGITTWNVTDADSWVPSFNNRPDWPLAFDANYNRKPAYHAMIEAVQ